MHRFDVWRFHIRTVLDCEVNLLLALPVFFLKFLSNIKSEDNNRVHGHVLCFFDVI